MKTEGRKEARSGRWQAADRVRCGEAYGSLPPPPSVLGRTPTLNVQMGSREALPHKGRTAVLWPRRGCRGLHLHSGAFLTAVALRRTYSLGYGIGSRPGARASAQSDGEYRPGSKTRVQERGESQTLGRRTKRAGGPRITRLATAAHGRLPASVANGSSDRGLQGVWSFRQRGGMGTG